LWVESVNSHPQRLASLSGVANRIEKLAATRESDTVDQDLSEIETVEGEEKKVHLRDLGKLTNETYNLASTMGTLLKDRFRFITLTGIRRAYSSAFSKHYSAIDRALANPALDALSLVRNVIVHKAGIVDQRYFKDSKAVPCAPKVDVDNPIVLDVGL